MKSFAKSFAAALSLLLALSFLGACNRVIYVDEEESEESLWYGDESEASSETESTGDNDPDPGVESVPSASSGGRPAGGSASTARPSSGVSVSSRPGGNTGGGWGGATVTVASIWNTSLGVQSKPDGDVQKLFVNKRKELEAKYNCKIVHKAVNPNDTNSQIIIKVKSGSTVGDILHVQRIDVERASLVTGILMDLNTVPNLNLKDSRWDKQMIAATTQNGVTYGTTFGYGDVQSGFLVNLDLYNKVKSKISFDLFDLVAKKQWTWDKYIQLCQAVKADLDANGTYNDKDQYGSSGTNQPTLMAILLGNGMQILNRRSNGKMEYVMNSQTTKDTVNFLKTNMVFNKSWHTFESNSAATKAFTEGRVLLFGVPIWQIEEIKKNAPKTNIGFVPPPMGNSGKVKNYINLADSWAGVYCITATNRNPERAGTLLTEYLALADQAKKLTLAQYEKEYFSKHAASMTGVKMMLDNMHYDPYLIEFNTTPWSALTAALWNPNDTIEAQLAAIDSQMKNWVQSTYNK